MRCILVNLAAANHPNRHGTPAALPLYQNAYERSTRASRNRGEHRPAGKSICVAGLAGSLGHSIRQNKALSNEIGLRGDASILCNLRYFYRQAKLGMGREELVAHPRPEPQYRNPAHHMSAGATVVSQRVQGTCIRVCGKGTMEGAFMKPRRADSSSSELLIDDAIVSARHARCSGHQEAMCICSGCSFTSGARMSSIDFDVESS
jgi:hypothetical protein